VDEGEGTPMDLDILEQVQGNIIGNCLCVLGDSMAMPVASMLKHFRGEFEQHMEQARTKRDLAEAAA
jgi:NADH-quinone oxidoreductase subunit F